MPDKSKSVNDKQLEAITHKDGPILIVAGAGSGKTKVLTHRVAWLIESGADPAGIVALTFTNKAAQEMRERIDSLLSKKFSGSKNSGNLFVGTFHSFCLRIIKERVEDSGLKGGFSIYDTGDTKSLLKKIIKNMGMDDSQFSAGKMKEFISRAKNELKTPDILKEGADSYFKEQASEIYGNYQKGLSENNAVDFDDILLVPFKIFRKNPEALKRYQEKFKYVLVDEYQDTNIAQYKLIRLLTEENKNLCVVGDVDQAIYGWRGADFRNILHFEKDYPDAKIVILEENYRSTKNILAAANAVIEKNAERKEKNLWTQNDEGPRIKIITAGNERAEAEYALAETMRLMGEEGFVFKDFVFLYRTNSQSRIIEETCIRNKIPYKIVGGIRFYDRKEIKDLLSYLRVVLNESDLVSMARIVNFPVRGLGKLTDGELRKISENEIEALPPRKQKGASEFSEFLKEARKLAEKSGVTEILLHVLKKSGLENQIRDGSREGLWRFENVMELAGVASDIKTPGLSGLAEFLDNIALLQESDSYEDKKNVLHLMTLHAVKGLEFPAVFIFGMEEGLVPHSRSLDSKDSEEEERRLFYVGITRAKKYVYLLRAKRRKHFGSLSENEPSRYLADIPDNLCDVVFHKTAVNIFAEDNILAFDEFEDDDDVFI